MRCGAQAFDRRKERWHFFFTLQERIQIAMFTPFTDPTAATSVPAEAIPLMCCTVQTREPESEQIGADDRAPGRGRQVTVLVSLSVVSQSRPAEHATMYRPSPLRS